MFPDENLYQKQLREQKETDDLIIRAERELRDGKPLNVLASKYGSAATQVAIWLNTHEFQPFSQSPSTSVQDTLY